MPLVLTALTAVSALGVGAAAHRHALIAGAGGLVPNDFDPAVGGWIGRVPGVEAHRLPARMANYDCRNNRLADMALGADGFAAAVAGAVARYGAGRIAVVLGTSTSGVTAAEEAYRERAGGGALPGGVRLRPYAGFVFGGRVCADGAGVAGAGAGDQHGVCEQRAVLSGCGADDAGGGVRRGGGRGGG